MDPTVYVPDHEDYNDAPRGSLSPIGNLPDSWGYVSPTNQNNYRNIIVTLTTRLLTAFGWLVGDAEWAMNIARGAHGAEWADFFHRGGAMTPGATERLMAAYLTRRGIPAPRSLKSLIQRTLQPHVPPPCVLTIAKPSKINPCHVFKRHFPIGSPQCNTAAVRGHNNLE